MKKENKIGVSYNSLGMIIFYCNHCKGYDAGKNKNICNKCMKIVVKKLREVIK